MFLDKHSRYFRRFDVRFKPRHSDAPSLPLWNTTKESFSVCDALLQSVKKKTALEVQSNNDIVELMDAKYFGAEKALVLLFHRASPNAADPTYRKIAREDAGDKVVLRHAKKEDGEEQSISAHFVIADGLSGKGEFSAVLEEIPGISMACVRRIIAVAMSDYVHTFKRGKSWIETRSSFTPTGVKSETMTKALERGRLGFVTLSRPAKADFVDGDGAFKAEREVLRLRITGVIDKQNWRGKFANLVSHAREKGWDDFKVDINLDDNRSRTVDIDRTDEASEILFVRSESATFKVTLDTCSSTFVDEIVEKAVSIARS